MRDQSLYESIDRYIDKYYIEKSDDAGFDNKGKSVLKGIRELREKRAARKKAAREANEYTIEPEDESTEPFDISDITSRKLFAPVSASGADNKNIEALIGQMDETFSQRLLRLIDEKGIKDSEVYNRAYVDRRHFSKIRKNVNYTPNKKTVLAFSIALELSIDEAAELLKSAGFAFSRSSKTDIIVAYFLQHKSYDMFEINEILYAYGQPVFE